MAQSKTMAKDPNIPANYQTVMPYLIIKNAGGFLTFMKEVFDAAEMQNVMRDENIIMHGEVTVGESTIMFAECADNYPPQPAGMFIYVDNADERFAKALEAGATVVNPVSDQPYGRSGGVKDAFGNTWWITSLSK